jgi:tRNA threonylcarbamoyladenosine biosynthesis protein TsaB
VILAIETATAACSAALAAADGRLVAERVQLEGPAHAQVLLRQVHEVLEEAGAEADAVETVVAGLGPGAFTGLRIGVATARGFAQAGDCRLGGVPSLPALALDLARSTGAASGDRGVASGARRIVPLIDGRRREVFGACYEWRDDGLREVESRALVPSDELEGYVARCGACVVGGDGALLYAERLPPSATLVSAVAAPTAAMVLRAWRAAVDGRREGFAEVLPIYGREPDAARWLGGKAS